MPRSNRYILFYKPYGVLTQFTDRRDPGSRPTLKDFIPVPKVYPVGRLDADSEGLLLLTDHGALQHWLTDPRYQHPRTYWVQVEHIPDETALEKLRQGINLSHQTRRAGVKQQRQTRSAQIQLLPEDPDLPPRDPPIRSRKSIPTAWLEIVLTEGLNRQVRRMTAAVGFPTLRLVRVAIAHLTLQGLAPGEWRDLTETERKSLLTRAIGSP
ncbi:pseudouridine synthase [Leptolyngbya sp. 'hensonii']|uniref:pseudouridine synthase n=1 Tax=Leptolyngbya sp. 'hensonii' TaxID=1922337 RepID=UPI0009501450|nr:pseudouridine synthase [Leptolyngbya sp. 'hensonii']OLP17094.1 pseudouridine synthase [Leptolyngbya sp. 'hensonii']